MARRVQPKHQHVFETLQQRIFSGAYRAGQKLPGELALVKELGTSRITVGRALRDLEAKGLVSRRAGSGTYVTARPAGKNLLFGLLIPALGRTEIFEPICLGLSRSPESGRHALLWGDSSVAAARDEDAQAWQLCRQYIDRGVSGVFFAPVEMTPAKDETNQRVIAALEKAQIPVVLLDRCIYVYPRRSRHDLVGIDNRRAGYMITEHLLELGCRRLSFVAYPRSAATVEARLAGYREALLDRGAAIEGEMIQSLDPADARAVRTVMESVKPEAFVCANDRTAGHLMHALIALGYRIPGDVRIVGIDDVEYASLLPVPLTTIHQPCRDIGEVAMTTMLERIARPDLPARQILLDVKLVVRQSCGADRSTERPGRTERF